MGECPRHLGCWKSEFLLFEVQLKTQWLLKEGAPCKCTAAPYKRVNADIIKKILRKLGGKKQTYRSQKAEKIQDYLLLVENI